MDILMLFSLDSLVKLIIFLVIPRDEEHSNARCTNNTDSS